MKIKPTRQQEEAVIKAKHWWKCRDRQVFQISGIAGAGKTTIVYMLTEELGLSQESVLFMAYVGKATLALVRSGNRAKTIHSTIYDVTEENVLDENDNPIKENGRNVTRLSFSLKKSLDDNIELLVIDEGAMVPEKMARDIMSFNIPIIVLGDINQLPPVFGESFFLRKPDVILTEPMRQSLDSPILSLAYKAMKGKYIPYGNYGNKCFVIKKDMMTDNMLIKSDVVICGKNDTRRKINNHVRNEILKRTTDYPIVGDKMICRQNNWKLDPIDENIFLINGLIGYVEDVNLESFDGQALNIDFRPEFLDDEMFTDIPIDYNYLLTSKDENRFRNLNKFEYAYAITCHLSQGSEYNKILIINERLGTKEYYNRWLYTAITRAKNGLILVI